MDERMYVPTVGQINSKNKDDTPRKSSLKINLNQV